MGVLIILTGIALFCGYWLLKFREWLWEQWFLVMIWRWLSGAPLTGDVLTDAGWFRLGTKAFTRTGHAVRWHYLPRWRRAAWRWAVTVSPIAAGWLWLTHRTAAVVAFWAALALSLALGSIGAYRRVSERKHKSTWLYPLHKRLAPVVNHPHVLRAEQWIHVEPDRSQAKLMLPAGFPAGDPDKMKHVVRIASASLAIESPEVSWKLAGPEPFVVLSKSQPPPARVALADVAGALAEARTREFVVGLGKKGALVKASLSGDAPHIGISMGSGAGKSVLAAFLMMQWLHRGGIVLLLDAKWHSHPWLIGMPNVAYARTTEELHASMCWLSEELDRRNQVVLNSIDTHGRVHANVGADVLVVGEELNVAMERLKAHWAEVRDPKADSKRSPALTGFGEVSYAGRAVRMHLLAIGQMLTARATGSSDSSVRESMGLLAMSRYTKRTWDMLAPQHPMPPSPTNPGRIQLVTARAVKEVQVPFVDLEHDPEPAREYAMSGIVTPCPSGMPCRQLVSAVPELAPPWDEGPDQPVVPGTGRPLARAAPRGVTLREAVDAGVIGPTVAAARIARHRAGDEFPEPVGYRSTACLYDPVQLAEWAKARRS